MKRCMLLLAGAFLPAIVMAQEKMVIPVSDSSALSVHNFNSHAKTPLLKATSVIFQYDYYENLGAACKAEFKIEKATKVPFRFRLGSLQQTDYLEQKPNALKPGQ